MLIHIPSLGSEDGGRMKIKELTEMAVPSQNLLTKTYYHGTTSEEAAESILKNGIQPPDLSLRKGLLKPVVGKVYCTSNLGYAQIYAIGGDMAGVDISLRKLVNKKGYLFVIPGSELKDIQPDEDSIGEFLSDILNMPNIETHSISLNGKDMDKSIVRNLYSLAMKYLSPSTLKKVKDGEYAYWAKAGKVLVKRLSDYDKIKMIEFGGFHIAHTGPIIPSQCWKINLEYIPQLKKDGSNFFELAERIK